MLPNLDQAPAKSIFYLLSLLSLEIIQTFYVLTLPGEGSGRGLGINEVGFKLQFYSLFVFNSVGLLLSWDVKRLAPLQLTILISGYLQIGFYILFWILIASFGKQDPNYSFSFAELVRLLMWPWNLSVFMIAAAILIFQIGGRRLGIR